MSPKVKYIPDYFMKSFWKFCVLSFDIFKKNLVELLDLMLLNTLAFFIFLFFFNSSQTSLPYTQKKSSILPSSFPPDFSINCQG